MVWYGMAWHGWVEVEVEGAGDGTYSAVDTKFIFGDWTVFFLV
jgi:hypothetical protein